MNFEVITKISYNDRYVLKHDNMHKNGIFFALICINNHISTSINCMLSYGVSFLVSFFYFLFIPRVVCKTPSLGEMFGLLKICYLLERITRVCFYHDSLD